MRLFDPQDTGLAIALIFGTGVIFGQPLRFVLSVAEDISSTYHVDLVPGFMIFAMAFTVHFWRKQKEAATAARLEARDAEEARRAAADLQELVQVSHALANSVDSEALRAELATQLPIYFKQRSCWLAASTFDGWRWLIEPPTPQDPDALLPLAQEVANAVDTDELGLDEWFVVVLRSGDLPIATMGISNAGLMPTERARAQAIGNIIAIALKNVNLFITMRTISVSDRLTGCYNRAHAFDTLALELKRSNRTRSPIAVVLLDVDDFKSVNDTWGHLAGDRLLEAIGSILRRTLRSTDTKCRYGGDEFLVILLDTPPDAARAVAEQLRRALEEITIPCEDGHVSCAISVGVAIAAPGELDPVALIERADRVMYLDKSSRAGNRNRIQPVPLPAPVPAVRTA